MQEDENQWSACCPAHDDRKASLRLTVGEDGLVHAYCHGGCDYGDVRAALVAARAPDGALGRAPKGKGSRSATSVARRPVKKLAPPPDPDYVERCKKRLTGRRLRELAEHWELPAKVLRDAGLGWNGRAYVFPVHDLRTGELVDLRLRRGGRTRHRTGGTARLYAPGGFRPEERVLLCEGEGDILTARHRGMNAVGVNGGAGAVPRDLEPLRDCEVVIAFDCDDAGRKGAVKHAAALVGVARSVAIADLKLQNKEDVRDWFVTYGRTAAELTELLDAAKPVEEEYETLGRVLTRADLARLPKPEPLIDDMLSLRSYVLMVGEGGTNKTFTALGFACSVATGQKWLDRAVVPGAVPVIYVVGEGAYGIDKRISAWEEANGVKVPSEMLTVLMKPDSLMVEGFWPELTTLAGRKGARLAVFDTLSSLAPDADEVKDAPVLTRRLNDLAADIDGTALLLHHTGWGPKDRGRGGSQFEHNADEVLVLQRVQEDDSSLVSMWRKKVKDGPDGERVWLRRVDVGESCVLELADQPEAKPGGPRTGRDLKHADLKTLVWQWVRENPPTTKTQVAEAVAAENGVSNRRVYTAFDALERERLIRPEQGRVPDKNGAMRAAQVWVPDSTKVVIQPAPLLAPLPSDEEIN